MEVHEHVVVRTGTALLGIADAGDASPLEVVDLEDLCLENGVVVVVAVDLVIGRSTGGPLAIPVVVIVEHCAVSPIDALSNLRADRRRVGHDLETQIERSVAGVLVTEREPETTNDDVLGHLVRVA
jgi:hypothetical protein